MFAERLKELRIHNKLSQSQLATAIGVTNQNVSDWENGKSETSFEKLIKLAELFMVSTDYLLGRVDKKEN